MKSILIIEDEPSMSAALAAVARRLSYESVLCFSGAEGIARFTEIDPRLVILDIGLPDLSGIEVLRQLRAKSETTPVLIITAHGNLENAVAAKKLGASGYLVKPFDIQELQDTLDQLLHADAEAIPPATVSESPGLMVGAAPAMQRSFVQIAHACASDVPVLITGPTGGGKTLAAKVIHANSARRSGPFITLHCNAIPDSLLESELFGHEKNAFTGAAGMKPGHIERAAGGTLFLDEIGDISLPVQAKLLRFVEERVFSRVGGREEYVIDLRIIAATNRALRGDVAHGRFREDLYYRLRVLEIEVPALRDRPEDIPAICAVFLGASSSERRLSPAALKLLCEFPWPGNVRELRNALEHATAVSSGSVILPQHLPEDIRRYFLNTHSKNEDALPAALTQWLDQQLAAGAHYDEIHSRIESLMLRHLLSHFDNKPTVMARCLEMNRVTLRNKLRQLAIPDES